MPSLSIRARIFLGFVVLLLAFGGATLYGVWAVRTVGQQLRLVALGYSTLRLELQDQQTIQANLQRRLADPDGSPRAAMEIAADRKLRWLRLQGATQRVQDLQKNLPKSDARFLTDVSRVLDELQVLYRTTAAHLPSDKTESQIEEQASLLLAGLSSRLTNKVVEVVSIGERVETRAVWMTIFLSLAAALLGAIVLFWVQATLRPLRRLCDSAREVGRGNYRVVGSLRDLAAPGATTDSNTTDPHTTLPSPPADEVVALAREFAAMAGALEERELRLRRSEQLAAIGKLAAQITHEVRNPLTAIGLNAELLADELAPQDSEAQNLARAIVKEVDRLTQITEQYLRFARLPEPHFERIDLNDVLRSLIQFSSEDLRTRGVLVETSLDSTLPPVAVDENQLRQALLNLMRNAVEAMTENQGAAAPRTPLIICVRTRRLPSGNIAIDIEDNGPGISPELQRQIFEPFFTTRRGGTGLGLALTQEVIARHRGQLRLTSPVSTTPSGGTRFTIDLPPDH